ncbi:LacI family DNA-binding transcriptional regulator [Streptomyces sp. NPDC059788]|uniref:LacI family DNA-binding transcriptional regulator n=1 Tax=Streptomyces sp. NPDC059788 TaxID=3346948 RepID=UPI003656C7D5
MEAGPETGTGAGTGPETGAGPVPGTGSGSGPGSGPGLGPGPGTETGAGPEAKAGTRPGPATGSGPGPATGSGTETGAGPEAKAEPGTRPDPATRPGSEPGPGPGPEAGPAAAPEAAPQTGPGTALPPLPPPPPPPLSTIWADDAAAMRSIIDHLYELGHRRIVHIAGLPGLAHTERRVAALRTEAARLGLDAAHVRSVSTDYSDEQGAEATRRLLAAPCPPTAIVYDNDVMAVAGAAVAAGRGVPVPGALSIVAWDDSPLCRVTHPRLTSLVRDTAGFGRLAAQELLSVLDGAPTRRLQAELPHLDLRESTTRAP